MDKEIPEAIEPWFSNRTAYRFIGCPLPSCFHRLEWDLHKWFPSIDETAKHPALMLAENLCRRMGDVEWYVESIADQATDDDE